MSKIGRLNSFSEDSDKPEMVEDLDLSVCTYNCLLRANIRTVKQLIKMSYEDLIHVKNLGKEGADEIVKRLSEF